MNQKLGLPNPLSQIFQGHYKPFHLKAQSRFNLIMQIYPECHYTPLFQEVNK